MAAQTKVKRVSPTKTKPVPKKVEVKPSKELVNEIDAVLDEIDAVLEQNAEEFVRNYVQKGGQ